VRLLDQFDGGGEPFEGDRTIVWCSLPANALVTRATLTVAPVLPPSVRTFVETLRLAPGGPAYGATVQGTGDALLIDFHARRAALRIEGLGAVSGTSLAVDIGGGVFLSVGKDGTIPALQNQDFDFSTGVLPGVAALRLRLRATGLPADTTPLTLSIATMPANITLRFGKLLPFFSRTGELGVPVTTPDITTAIQRAQADATVVNGYCQIPVIVHSDTLGRIALTIDVQYLGSAALMPAGLREVVLPFDHASVTTTAPTALQAMVPAGAVVQAPQTALAVRGGFEASRVAYGPTGPTPQSPLLHCSATETLAQRLTPQVDITVSGIDLFVAADGPAARLALDLRVDAGGKPGTASLLAGPATLDLTGDPSGRLQWCSATLKTPALLTGSSPSWLVVQAIDGSAQIGGASAAGSGLVGGGPAVLTQIGGASAVLTQIGGASAAGAPTPQRSADAGFSWRVAGAAAPLLLRLRNVPDRFHMPIDFVAGSGAQARRVSLAAYDAAGKIDAVLDRAEIAGAVQDYIALAVPAPCADREVLENTRFTAWAAQGGTLVEQPAVGATTRQGVVLIETFRDQPAATLLDDTPIPRALAFSVDGGTLFVAEPRALQAIDLQTGSQSTLGHGLSAIGLAANRGGNLLLVLDANGLSTVEVTSGQVVPILPLADAAAMALSPDGGIAYVAGSARIVAFDLNRLVSLFDIATGSPAIAVSGDGSVLAAIDPNTFRVVSFDAMRGTPAWSVAPAGGLVPVALAFAADGSSLYVLAEPQISPVRAAAVGTGGGPTLFVYDGRGRQMQSLELANAGFGSSGLGSVGLVVKPQGDRVYVAGTALALDPSGGRLAAVEDGTAITVVAVGDRRPVGWALTAGQVAPAPLRDADPTLVGAVLTEGALSLVRAVSGCAHELAVAAATVPSFASRRSAGAPEAVAEVFWYDPTGVVLRSDLLALPAASAVVTQSRRLTPPLGSAQAETRISVTGGACLLDTVSLRAVATLLQGAGWQPDASLPARIMSSADAQGRTWRNLGADDGAVVQSVPLVAGVPLALGFDGQVVAGEPSLALRFVDGGGVALGADVAVALVASAFRQQPAKLSPPANAASVSVRILLPAGSALRVNSLALTPDPAAPVPVGFIAQSPGELHVTAARIVYDIAPGALPAVPPNGLVAPTPPGAAPGTGGSSGDDCCRKTTAALGTITRALPSAMAWPTPRIIVQPAAIEPELRAVPGIGPARERRLVAAGITSVSGLAAASPERIGTALVGPATTPELVATLIEEARSLLLGRARGGGP
jgi:hypothetical protein